MKNLILVIVFAVIIGGMIWLGRPNRNISPENQVAVSTSGLIIDKTFHDFGTISMQKGKVSTTYVLTNNSSDPIKTAKLYTSCMCTTAQFVQNGKVSELFGMPGHGPVPTLVRSIASGEKVDVIVIFDPAAHGPAGIGIIERAVRLETVKGITELNFRANVIP